MKKLFVFVIFAVLTLSAFAERGQFAVPDSAELDEFPVLSGPLSSKQQAEMGLAPTLLKQAVVFQNHFRNLRDKKGRFVLETLPADTLVLVDQKGVIRYKADCGNRLVEIPSATVKSSISYLPLLPEGGKPLSEWQRFKDAFGRGWRNVLEALGLIIPLLFLIFIIALFLWFLYQIAKAIQEWYRGRDDSEKKRIAITPTPDYYDWERRVTAPPIPEPIKQESPVRARRFRLTIGKDGNVFAKMEGYRNLRVDEDSDGNLTVNADRS